MTWLNGFAEDPHGIETDPWAIVDGNKQPLASFDHSTFWRILDGAPVLYTDDDGDGFAENVQPATAFARYTDRASLDASAPAEAFLALRLMIGTALLQVNDVSGEKRGKALRRLRAQIDRFKFTGTDEQVPNRGMAP